MFYNAIRMEKFKVQSSKSQNQEFGIAILFQD